MSKLIGVLLVSSVLIVGLMVWVFKQRAEVHKERETESKQHLAEKAARDVDAELRKEAETERNRSVALELQKATVISEFLKSILIPTIRPRSRVWMKRRRS